MAPHGAKVGALRVTPHIVRRRGVGNNDAVRGRSKPALAQQRKHRHGDQQSSLRERQRGSEDETPLLSELQTQRCLQLALLAEQESWKHVSEGSSDLAKQQSPHTRIRDAGDAAKDRRDKDQMSLTCVLTWLEAST